MTELPPPSLGENGSYENWRNEIQMWQITTTMEPKRQALAVRTKLSGKVREIALKLDAADLNTDSGMSFLIDALDVTFRKKPKKWDVINTPSSTNNGQTKDGVDGSKKDGGTNQSAADKARQRASQLSAKLAAEGKYQTHPLSLLPKAGEQFNKNKMPMSITNLINIKPAADHQVPPEVKKLENGNSFAEFNINDVCARPFLTRMSTRDLISQQSGSAISLRGRFLTQEDKRQAIITGVSEKPLVLMIQANVAAKVQVALHKIMEVCRNYEKFGADNNFNNYGLSNNTPLTSHHFVQDKLFVGIENMHPDFNMIEKLAGESGANFSFMIQQTGAKVYLRGRGSGYSEPNSGRESFEALHIYISHPRQDGLNMVRQLCESLIETVKTKYQEWGRQRITQAANPTLGPRYGIQTYPPNNGYPIAYASIPSLMSKEVRPPSQHADEHQSPPRETAQASRFPVAVTDYRLSQGPTTNMQARPIYSQHMNSVNESRPESNFEAKNPQTEERHFGERYENGPNHYDSPNDDRRFEETDNREKKTDHGRRMYKLRTRDKARSRSRSKSPNKPKTASPESKKSRSRESKSKTKEPKSPRRSPTRKKISPSRKDSSPRLLDSSPRLLDSSPRRDLSPRRNLSPRRDLSPRRNLSPRRDLSPRWDSSPRRDLSPRRDSPSVRKESARRESSPSRRGSSPARWDSSPAPRGSSPVRRGSSPSHRGSPPDRRGSPPARRGSPHVRKESPPPKKEERAKRRFTEEPKKKRKFSEDPRLLEQAKEEFHLQESSPPPEREIKTRFSMPQIPEFESELPPPKLQFRSKKKEDLSKKPKGILKMAPPPMLPIAPKKVNGTIKSVKISPAGLAAKKAMFKMPPPPPPIIEIMKPPTVLPQKVLNMGALSSLTMYDDDSDED